MENQIEKKMENEMETGLYGGSAFHGVELTAISLLGLQSCMLHSSANGPDMLHDLRHTERRPPYDLFHIHARKNATPVKVVQARCGLQEKIKILIEEVIKSCKS